MYPTQRCSLQLQRLGEPPATTKVVVLARQICYMIHATKQEGI